MSGLRALAVVAVALGLQAGLGRMFPGIHRYVDALLVPVVLYGVGSSQRAALGMGCVTGLLADTWFFGGPFGLNGLKRTFLGWALGGFAGWVDLNHTPGRMITGAIVAVADDLLDLMVRALLDAHPDLPGPIELTVKAVVTALLAALGGAILDRTRRHGRRRSEL